MSKQLLVDEPHHHRHHHFVAFSEQRLNPKTKAYQGFTFFLKLQSQLTSFLHFPFLTQINQLILEPTTQNPVFLQPYTCSFIPQNIQGLVGALAVEDATGKVQEGHALRLSSDSLACFTKLMRRSTTVSPQDYHRRVLLTFLVKLI